jgi:hypothetical protein
LTTESLFSPLAVVLGAPFRGEEWQGRFVIGSALLFLSIFIPILPALVVSGYFLEVMRAAMRGRSLELPSWSDWSRMTLDGLKASVVGLSYLLPGILVIVAGACLYCASVIPLATLSEAQSSSQTASWLGLLLPMLMLVLFLSTALGSLLIFLGAIPLPVATARLAEGDALGAAYHLRQLSRLLSANPMDYFIAWVVMLGLWAIEYGLVMIAYYTLFLACLIPFFLAPLSFYSLVIGAALFGGAYRRSLGFLNLPLPEESASSS